MAPLMSPDKLVYMANQIGKFFASQGDEAVAGIADHLQKYWDPRMRSTIVDHLDRGGHGLDPLARHAVERLQRGDIEKLNQSKTPQ
jgi:formate dehydrogenase subunit delta